MIMFYDHIMLHCFILIGVYQKIYNFIILLLVSNKENVYFFLNNCSILERLSAARSNEMVKLLTTKYDYQPISIESFEEINLNKNLLLTYIDPDGEHDEICWEKRFFTIINTLFDQIWKSE